MSKRYCHSGKWGDCIWALPSLRALGAGHLRLVNNYSFFPLNKENVETIAPLLRLQPYIQSVEYAELASLPPDITDLNVWWMGRGIVPGLSICGHVLERFGLPLTEQDTAWITVPEPTPVSKYIFCRTSAWQNHNQNMPWPSIVDQYGKEAVFIGHKSEYYDFCAKFPIRKVDYWPTKGFLEIAQAMAAAEFIFCNQSGPHAVAESMKKPLLLEVCPGEPSVVYERLGAAYAWKETVDLTKLEIL